MPRRLPLPRTARQACREARSALLCAQHLHRQQAHAGAYCPTCPSCRDLVEVIVATDDLCKHYHQEESL